MRSHLTSGNRSSMRCTVIVDGRDDLVEVVLGVDLVEVEDEVEVEVVLVDEEQETR